MARFGAGAVQVPDTGVVHILLMLRAAEESKGAASYSRVVANTEDVISALSR